MSAGYIQLAAIGQQDAYLTGTPQVTYFSGVYKRHTPFVLEAYDIPFLGQKILYGSNNICRIPPKGDLIRGLTLKMDLPALTNPGNYWTWPIASSITYLPRILINGFSNVAPLSGNVSYYSTLNTVSWLVPPLTNYISYNSVSNKFIFSNCANVEVDTDFGVFWGLDPKNGTARNANLIYTVGSSSNLSSNSMSNTTPKYISTVTRTSDFTLEQAGWLQVAGIVNPKTGLFLRSFDVQTLSTSVVGTYINFASITNSGKWTNYFAASTAFNVTNGGRVQFGGQGMFLMRAVLGLDAGSVATLSYGSDATSTIEPTSPIFEAIYTCRVSPDPSMPIMLPINVTSSNTYYFYITTASGATTLLSESWFSFNPLEEAYVLNASLPLATQNNRVNFYGVTPSRTGSSLQLASDSTFTFLSTGMYLVTGTVILDNPPAGQYVANVSVSNVTSNTVVYTYDMSLQGRDPTFTFSMPLTISDTTQRYSINVATTTSTSTSLAANTFFAIHQYGVLSDLPSGTVLPYNGILLKPSVGSMPLNGTMNLSSNFSSTSNSSIITVTPRGTLQVANTGVFMMTATMCSQYPIQSITFGETTYPVGLGLLPPYTFTVPTVVSTLDSPEIAISFTSNVATSQSILSNTFITVFPVASNTFPVTQFNYVDSVGTWAIQSAELKIGGQSIQTLTGEYIEMWNDLNVSYENQPGLTLLTGKYDSSNVYPPGRTYYTNLPFYFYGHPELSLPIVSLDRQDVEVHVTFRNFNELTGIFLPDPSLTATILVEYVYLSDPEINWFKSHRLEYLITQCQYKTFDLLPNFRNAIFKLEFVNPVRELFFIIQPVNNANYDYTNNGLLNMGLSFNGTEVFTTDATDTLYMGSLQPYIHYNNYPSRQFYMYPFTTTTGTGKPFGQVNMSRIRQILLELNTNPYYQAKQLRITAVNYNVLRIENGLAGVMFNSGATGA